MTNSQTLRSLLKYQTQNTHNLKSAIQQESVVPLRSVCNRCFCLPNGLSEFSVVLNARNELLVCPRAQRLVLSHFSVQKFVVSGGCGAGNITVTGILFICSLVTSDKYEFYGCMTKQTKVCILIQFKWRKWLPAKGTAFTVTERETRTA
jgi:hypothetical protein